MRSRKALSAVVATAVVVSLVPTVFSQTAFADSDDVTVVSVADFSDAVTVDDADSDSDADADVDSDSGVDVGVDADGSDADADTDADAVDGSDGVTADDGDADAGVADDAGSGSDADGSGASVLSNGGSSSDAGSSDAAGVSLSVPVVSSVSLGVDGVSVSWGAVDGASGYEVLRKLADSAWSDADVIADVSDGSTVSYTDEDTSSLSVGSTYVYTVRAYATTDGVKSYSGFDETGKSLTILEGTSLSGVDHTSKSTVKLTWNAVDGASKYVLYRGTSKSSLSKVKTTTSTSYSDSSLSNGKSYYYAVQAVGSDAASVVGSGVKVVKMANPTLKSAANASKGVKVTWSKVSGASGYIVYRKAYSSSKKAWGSWKRIKTIGSASTTSYTDTASLSSGTKYKYTVRAYQSGSGFTNRSWYNSGVTETRLSIPTLKSAANASKGIKVSWSKVKGASGYIVYRKTSGGSWKRIKKTTSTSYTDTASLKGGTKYVYTVRAYKGSDKSWYKSGVSETKLAIPSLKSASKSSKGIKVTWKKVTGASGYIVYRKAPGGSWKRIKKTTSTSYRDTSTTNVKYIYTVRAYKGSDKSWYKSSGISAVSKMTSKAQSYTSKTKYLVLVDRSSHTVAVYSGKKGNWKLKYAWNCVTGKSSTPTITGSYLTTGYKRTRLSTDARARWCTQISGGYFFHSILSSESELNQSLSHGCIRLPVSAAKWMYNNIGKGTRVVIYN